MYLWVTGSYAGWAISDSGGGFAGRIYSIPVYGAGKVDKRVSGKAGTSEETVCKTAWN